MKKVMVWNAHHFNEVLSCACFGSTYIMKYYLHFVGGAGNQMWLLPISKAQMDKGPNMKEGTDVW